MLVLYPAMGILQRYYSSFAQYMTEQALAQTLWTLAADWFNREFLASESVGTPAQHGLIHCTRPGMKELG